MPDSRKIVGIVGMFSSPADLVRAAEKTRDAGWKRWDCYTPYPVHDLDEAMGARGSFIPKITIPAAFTGAILAKSMQWWMSAYDFPLIIGGTPLFALPAFAPVTFELFVLTSALITFFTLIFSMKLLRWHSPLHDAGLMEQITTDTFALYLDASDKRFATEESREFLQAAGAEEIHVLYESEDRDRARDKRVSSH